MTEEGKSRGAGRALLVAFGIAFCIFLAAFALFFIGMHRDTVWKWEVRGKVQPDALRAWASEVVSKEKTLPVAARRTSSHDYLTNAPDYITKIEGVEMVLPDADNGIVTIVYGGGMYHWGLTIGSFNLTEEMLISHHYAEKWAPGIYYWSGD